MNEIIVALFSFVNAWEPKYLHSFPDLLGWFWGSDGGCDEVEEMDMVVHK